MQDAPNERELIEAVAQFLNEEIVPLTASDPRLRFRSLIAANVLAIVARELTESQPLMEAEWRRLSALLGRSPGEPPAQPQHLRQAIEDGNRELCAQIRSGQADEGEWRESLTRHLQATTEEKLQIANPRFLQRELAG